MRILMIHNYYQNAGGEDIVYNAEKKLLHDNGHEVIEYLRDNHEVKKNGLISTAIQSIWSIKTYRELQNLIKTSKPDIAHFHNTFFRVSPSAYYACYHSRVPVVQTLHNFRLLCPAAILFRNDNICEDCLDKKIQWPGIIHGCWQHSMTKSAVIATLNGAHHFIGTWNTKVDRYIALTDFCKQKFEEGGLPAEKMVVKPNFASNSTQPSNTMGEYALFVGRISHEKGLNTLLEAWKSLSDIPLKIVGEGPFMEFVKAKLSSEQFSQVELIGQISYGKSLEIISHARFLVVPSKCYETFSMVVIEAFSCGIPVIVPDTHNFACLVQNGKNGLFFKNGDSSDLSEKVGWAWSHPEEMLLMGKAAYEEYQQKYTADTNYSQLIQIYNDTISIVKSRNK
jgi:glycosyltransferase involved in cell wall biosynthesis